MSYAELSTYLHLDQTYDQSLVTMLGLAARIAFEATAKIKIMQASYQVQFDRFNDFGLVIPVRPLQSITSVTYQDQNNVTQTLAPTTGWLLNKKPTFSKLQTPPAVTFPQTYVAPNAVTIQFIAGISNNDPTHVPAPIKTAILLWASHLYENREPISHGNTPGKMPFALDAIMSLYNAPEV